MYGLLPSQTSVLFFNLIAHDIFGTRSVERDDGSPTLDTHVACLFANMKPGTRMITLHPIYCLGRGVTEENQNREKRGLKASIDASFFLHEKISIGGDAVTWTCKEICVYVYTRVQQSDPNGCAMFLCDNVKCPWQMSPTMAVGEDGMLQDVCIYCDSKRMIRTRQSRQDFLVV